MENTLLMLFGTVFILVGGVIIMFVLRSLFRAYASKHWSTTPGMVEQIDTRRVFSHAGEVNHHTGHAADMIDCRYRYDVNGHTYTGTRVTFADNTVKTGRALSRLTAQYNIGDTVTVYYDPNSPDQAVLKPGPSFYQYMPLITPILFLGTGSGMIYYGVVI